MMALVVECREFSQYMKSSIATVEAIQTTNNGAMLVSVTTAAWKDDARSILAICQL